MASKKKVSLEKLQMLLEKIMAVGDRPFPIMEIDPTELEFDIDKLYARPPEPSVKSSVTDTTAPSLSGTLPICIRVPVRVIHAFKVQAAKTGGSYQAMMNRVLSTAAVSFV